VSLFYQGAPYPNWKLHNKDVNRFFVVNLTEVIDRLGVLHTRMEPCFKQALAEIRASDWVNQYKSNWICSHTQITPENRRRAKTFSRAAAIIVALELYADQTNAGLNVYDYLRVLPAFYWVDQFETNRLAALSGHYQTMSPAQRTAAFGQHAKENFAATILAMLDQITATTLLDELADGWCVTRFIAERLCTLINTPHFPQSLHIGPVLGVGEESANPRMRVGRNGPAQLMRVPRFRTPEQLRAEGSFVA
jgi:hypothetical protein